MANGTRIVRKNPDAFPQLLARLRAVTLTVGIHATERDEGGGPMAVIAGVHEFGSARVPARPFMRPTVWTKRDKYRARLRGAIKKAVRGTGTLRADLAVIGEGIVSDMQRTIRAQGEPADSFAPLSDETVAARDERRVASNKGRLGKRRKNANDRWVGHKALIDTGRLINSIRWVLTLDGAATSGAGRQPRSRRGSS